jgi:hypothetical protein
VDNGKGGRLFLKVHQFAQIGKGDVIDIDPAHTSRISVVSCEDPSDLIRVSPHFELKTSIRLGEQDIAVRLTEIVTTEDAEAYA